MADEILRKVDFGHVDAEADINLLKYFIQTNSYRQIFSGKKMFVIGRKGTGKSAIYVTLESLRDRTMLVTGLTFDDYPWQVHKKIKDDTKSVDFAHVNSWKYLILLELAKQVLSEGLPKTDDLEDIRKFIESNYGTVAPSFKEFFIDRASRLKKLNLPAWTAEGATAGGFELEDSKTAEQTLMANINVVNQQLKAKLFKLMSEDKFYFIMFDRLDEAWDDSPDFKSAMVGILQATRDLNLDARKARKDLRCVPFLRSDIYDRLNYNDKNKAFYDIEFLNWDGAALESIVEKRIAFYGGIQEADAWDAIFDKKPLAKNTTNLNYLLKRTLLRPRDIIAFCEACKEVAGKKGHALITGEDIYDAETKYSKYMYNEWVDENHKQHPYLVPLLTVLRTVHCERFTFPEFADAFAKTDSVAKFKTLNPESAIALLFELSIVGIESIGGATGGSGFHFKYSNPEAEADTKKTFVVHPSLKKELKLIEFRTKREKS